MPNSVNQIWSLIEIRRFKEARKILGKAFVDEPENVELYYANSYLDVQERNLENALNSTSKGLSLNPNHEGLLEIRFEVLVEIGNYSEAEIIIIELISKTPSSSDYLASYSRLMMLTFNFDKAKKLSHEALRCSPNNINARVVQLYLNTIDGKNHLADEDVQKLLSQDPNNEFFLALMVDTLNRNKRYNESQLLLQTLVRIDPSNEEYKQAIIGTSVQTHWSSWPCWPVIRYGWGASIGIWLGVVFIFNLLGDSNEFRSWLSPLSWGYLIWVVYTWIQPFLLNKWLSSRGL